MATGDSLNLNELGEIIQTAKTIARRYRQLTGRPLGITGEVAEYEAARLLGLELATVRQTGFDAMRRDGAKIDLLQVKGRCVITHNPGQRIGKIQLDREWDGVVLVLLNAELEPTEIYEARRPEIIQALTTPGSKARNERGALSVSKFKSIGKLIWSASK